jgi:hypothetical protein
MRFVGSEHAARPADLEALPKNVQADEQSGEYEEAFHAVASAAAL